MRGWRRRPTAMSGPGSTTGPFRPWRDGTIAKAARSHHGSTQQRSQNQSATPSSSASSASSSTTTRTRCFFIAALPFLKPVEGPVAARLAPYVTSRGCRLRRSEVARLNQNLKKRVCHSPPYAAEHLHRWNYRRCFADAARKQAGQHMTGPARLPSLVRFYQPSAERILSISASGNTLIVVVLTFPLDPRERTHFAKASSDAASTTRMTSYVPIAR